MSDDRKDPIIRKGALLLSSLVLTPDKGLAAYRDRRMADKNVDLEAVKNARVLLDAVSFVLRSERREDWQKLERACDALRAVKPPKPEEDAPAPADEPASKLADEPTALADEPTEAAPPAPPPAPPPVAPLRAAPLRAAPLAPAAPPPVAPVQAAPPPVAPPPAPPPVAPVQAAPPPPPPPAPPPPAPAPAAPPPVVPSAVPAPPPPVAIEPPQAVGVDATAFVDTSKLAEASLPFQALGDASPPTPIADELPPRGGNVDETAAMGVEILADALPFADSGEPDANPPSPASFTLEQYASLCAERDVADAAGLPKLLERYALDDPTALQALDEKWRKRLEVIETRSEFDALRARYRQWLEEQRSG